MNSGGILQGLLSASWKQATSLPFTAWEQAVFVALFIVLIGLILGWVSRENRLARTFQQQEAQAREKAQGERDAEWRLFLEQQRTSDAKVSEAVQRSLEALTEMTGALAQEVQAQRAEFSAHDAMEKAKLDEMSATIHRTRKTPRA